MRVTNSRLPIHFMPGRSLAACGEYAYAAGSTTLGSIDVSEVTCARCMGTDTFMGAALVYRNRNRQDGGLSVSDKVAIGQVSNDMTTLIGELDSYLANWDRLDSEIEEREYALRVFPWWDIRHLGLRLRWLKELRDLKRERGY
jgi:hypothetical protein